jgi:hypothetical protein
LRKPRLIQGCRAERKEGRKYSCREGLILTGVFGPEMKRLSPNLKVKVKKKKNSK